MGLEYIKDVVKMALYSGFPLQVWQFNLNRLKNLHKGKSCILIGNGPSVKYSDLDKINSSNSIKFVFNRFHKAYENIDFTPNYTVVIDPYFIRDFYDELLVNHRGCLLIGIDSKFPVSLRNFYFRIKSTDPFEFSLNPLKYISTGASVVVSAIQLAYFMGMKDIYLYGIDHSFEYVAEDSEDLIMGEGNHFIENYRSGKRWCPPNLPLIENGFKCSAEMLELKNGKLINISRESRLPHIKKENFDDIIHTL
ncbi:DUF115 domain-containing protein [Vibrio sp. CAIM 722]|uniref:DUF115 domain-containing protein n=1 Tax=Vibrio eleionomae TaxID=2653505 RepID=A0A7X4LPK7_9VIBR|nr:6-hydroxymethylpterin diphosphokinase MptE-like protein [Vibrio eleionomae]MZI95804.1 DUF115 domain-containing protein [Vibrio eleionomae]